MAEAAAPHARHGTEQDAGRPAGQRVPRAAAEQRGRVLRLVLRLLPARGLRPAVGHLHREDCWINEEVERLRHSATNSLLTAATSWWSPRSPASTASARRRSTSTGWSASRSATRSTATTCCAASSTSSTRATTWRSPAAPSGSAATPSRSSGLGLAVRIEMFGDEIEALFTLHPLAGEVISDDNQVYVFPASHYVAGPERMERAVNDIEKELGERLAELEKQGDFLEAQRLHAYDVRPGDAPPDRLLLRRRELLDALRRPRTRLPAEHADRLFRTTSCSSSTSRTSRSRRSVPCTRATPPASAPSSTTASGCLRPGQPAPEVGGVPAAHRADRICRRPRGSTNSRGVTASSSRSSAPPA